ncbi:MAG: Crp/Fnr family transcriptional regulator [Gemmatimonadaceae bacterium]|nr:Crp/Fnr family transcriptional regulator [Gemmatimonadaceae bacterium]
MPSRASSSEPSPLLRQIPLFADLDNAALVELARHCIARRVRSGHLLFTAGQPCRGLYMIETGRVRIYRTSPDGREQILHIEGPGRPVAELPLLDGGSYPASAVTTEDSHLLFLPKAAFESLYRTHPDIAQAIIRALGRRLRHLVRLTETLAFRDVSARLALLLVTYAERRGTPTPNGVEIVLDRTQEELALEIGTARESVSRAMKQLRRAGLIRTAARPRIVIPDLARLQAMLPASEQLLV